MEPETTQKSGATPKIHTNLINFAIILKQKLMKTNYLIFSCLFLVVFGNFNGFSQVGLNAKLPKNLQEKAFDTLRALPSGMARIIFHRQTNIVGAAAQHYLFDRGDNIRGNAFIEQREFESDPKGNYYNCKNIVRMYLKLDKRWSALILGYPAKADSFNCFYHSQDTLQFLHFWESSKSNKSNFALYDKTPTVFYLLSNDLIYPNTFANNIISKTRIELSPFHLTESNGLKTKVSIDDPTLYFDNYDIVFKEKQIKFRPNIILKLYQFNNQPQPANSEFLGFIKSNETIIWDRMPGKMKLEYIDGLFCQTFGPHVNVLSGHTYLVEFNYGKASYKITDLN